MTSDTTWVSLMWWQMPLAGNGQKPEGPVRAAMVWTGPFSQIGRLAKGPPMTSCRYKGPKTPMSTHSYTNSLLMIHGSVRSWKP